MISRRSTSVSGPHTVGRLLTWAAATTVAGALVGLSAPLAASADTATTRPAADHQLTAPASVPLHLDGNDPKGGREPIRWLDATIVSRGMPGGPVNFAVSANNGAPFVFDPRSEPLGWQSLRRVPGSRGAFVTNITATEDAGSATGGTLAIVARTSDSNIFFTICDVRNALPQAPAPLPCSPWQRLRD